MSEGLLVRLGSFFPPVHIFDGIFPFNSAYLNFDNIINYIKENKPVENLRKRCEEGHYKINKNRKELN